MAGGPTAGNGGLPAVVDTHFHLDHTDFAGEAGAVWTRAREAGVSWGITIGTDPDVSGPAALALADSLEGLYVAVGLHPHEAERGGERELWQRLARLAGHPRVVAVGETGLDFHYDFASPRRQEEAFRRQLELAHDLHLPLILHVREAYEEVLALMDREGPPPRGGVFHCFSAGPDLAEACEARGFHLGFGGLATFNGTEAIQAAARATSPARILLETDAPYLAPVPRRGRRNEPAYVRFVLNRLAQLRGETPAALARETAESARRLFSPGGEGHGER